MERPPSPPRSTAAALPGWRVGDVRITRVVERVHSFRLTHTLPSATDAALAAHRSWLAPHFLDARGHFDFVVQAFVIESRGRRIVVDTCVGERTVPGYEYMGAPGSAFLADLAAAGAPRAAVDVVLCTHLHFDHVGWNTMRDGGDWVPTFPNARYLFAAEEWRHWQTETDRGFAGTVDRTVEPVLAAGLADLVETTHRITDEVRLEPLPGHTPGHVAVWIESRGARAIITGDATHHPVQWAEPAWGVPADTDPARATATRERFRRAHADHDVLIIGAHYSAPSAGYIVSHADGFRFAVEREA